MSAAAARFEMLEHIAKENAHTGNRAVSSTNTYCILDAGAGPRQLPDWMVDARVRWSWGYSNRPGLEFRFSRNPSEGTVYRNDGGKGWFGANPTNDCFSTHWHAGRVSMAEFEEFVRWDTEDGKYQHGCQAIKRKFSMLATSQQEGYAGRAFDIQMADDSPLYAGEKVRLRGPWHGGTGQNGLVGIVGVVWGLEDIAKELTRPQRWRRGWQGATKCFGYNIRETDLINAIATFLPHCPIARVMSAPNRDGVRSSWVEPCLPEIGVPRLMEETQRRDSEADL